MRLLSALLNVISLSTCGICESGAVARSTASTYRGSEASRLSLEKTSVTDDSGSSRRSDINRRAIRDSVSTSPKPDLRDDVAWKANGTLTTNTAHQKAIIHHRNRTT